MYHRTGRGAGTPSAAGRKREKSQVHLPELEFVYGVTASFGYLMVI